MNTTAARPKGVMARNRFTAIHRHLMAAPPRKFLRSDIDREMLAREFVHGFRLAVWECALIMDASMECLVRQSVARMRASAAGSLSR